MKSGSRLRFDREKEEELTTKKRYRRREGKNSLDVLQSDEHRKTEKSSSLKTVRTVQHMAAHAQRFGRIQEQDEEVSQAEAEAMSDAGVETVRGLHTLTQHSGRLRFECQSERTATQPPFSATRFDRQSRIRMEEAFVRGSNPQSRQMQKQAIKRQYAKWKRTSHMAGPAGKVFGSMDVDTKQAVQKAGRVWNWIRKSRAGLFLIVIPLALLMLMSGLSSCSVFFQGIGSTLAVTTYPSRDEAMLAAEEAYAQLEADLKCEIDNYEALHDGYDEYHYELGDIGHDPYVLISLLSAYQEGEWKLTDVEGMITELFDRQYALTENVEHETRYRTETYVDPETGETKTRKVPYDYYICTVVLENADLSHLPVVFLNEEQLGLYANYMATLGNRPDLFPKSDYPNASEKEDYLDYNVPPEALEDDEFAAMVEEAEKYLGYPYVWGGTNPATSFDCSGFVCWVLNHSGWDVGRLSAQGLCDYCTPVSKSNVRPGDLIFFKGTYDTPGISHCGIYVGGGMMIHCGSPISYANINTTYWQSHFYTFGRLP